MELAAFIESHVRGLSSQPAANPDRQGTIVYEGDLDSV